MPVLSAAEVGSEYTARPLLWEVPVAPSPCAATSSVKSPASALRGSHVPGDPGRRVPSFSTP